MTSDNVFSDWLTSLVTFFDKTLLITARDVTRGEYNIPTSCTIRNQRKRRDKSLFKG
jgi:hypothetical protein